MDDTDGKVTGGGKNVTAGKCLPLHRNGKLERFLEYKTARIYDVLLLDGI